MLRFLESILIENGHMPVISWHEQRFANTQELNFGKIVFPSLESEITRTVMPHKKNIRYKCRVVYDSENIRVEFSEYKRKQIEFLIIKEDNEISYPFKYEDRRCFAGLTKDLQHNEEVLIVKNGLLTDTSFTNIALFDGTNWETPSVPLLPGIRRRSLMEENIICEKDIRIMDLEKYSKIRLFNALVGWEEAWELDTGMIMRR